MDRREITGRGRKVPAALFLFLQRQALHHGLVAELAAHAVHGALGGGAALAGLVDQVGRVGVLGVGQRADADAEQAVARAVDLARQQVARRRRRFCRRAASDSPASARGCGCGSRRSSASASRSSRRARFSFSRVGHLLRQRPRAASPAAGTRRCRSSKVVSADTLLVSRSGSTTRSSMPRDEPRTAAGLRRRSGASGRARRRAAGRRSGGSRRLAKRAARDLADAVDEAAPACRPRNAAASAWPSTAKPRGLSRSEAILARNLLADKPDRDRDADARSRRARQSARATLAGAHAVQPLGAGQVHERLVDRERLDLRGQVEHQRAHLAADARRISPCSGGRRWRAGRAAAPRTSASPSARRRCARRSRRSRRRRACRRR